ncbi:GntR family transcriptional regulator [Kribbella sp. WER1]
MSNSTPLSQVVEGDPRSLRDQVRQILRNWIVSGRLQPGVRLRELEVAEELGISRVPVREAIAMLEAEGLLTSVPRRGVLVKQLQVKDIEDLFDIREALEALVARRAATRATTADIRRTRWLLEEARHALEDGDDQALAAANLGFHEAITELADNPPLSAMLEPVGVRLRWHFATDRDSLTVLSEHTQLLDAIANRDPDLASTLATDHVRATRAAIVPSFANPPTASS